MRAKQGIIGSRASLSPRMVNNLSKIGDRNRIREPRERGAAECFKFYRIGERDWNR